MQGRQRVQLWVPPEPTGDGRRAGVGLCVALAIGYVAGAWAALHATDTVVDGVKLFAPAGMTLVALLSTRRRDWPLLVGLIMACEFALDTVEGFPWTMSIGFAAGNALHPLLSASILRRWGPADPFATPGALLRHLAVVATVGPAASAVVGVATLAAHIGAHGLLTDLAHWYLGDAWGAMLVGTALLAVLAPRPPARHRADPARGGERIALLLAVTALTGGAYFTGSLLLRWLVLPLVVVVALRGGLRSTGLAMLIVTAVAELAVSTGYGLSEGLTKAAALDALQGYLAVTLLCAVLLAVETTRRHRLQHALVAAELERLEADLVRSRHFEAIGQRAGGLAHDFNNLLGVIRNYAEHLQRDERLTGGGRDDLGQIAEAAARGGELVHRLLAIARADELDAVELDLGTVAVELVDLLRVPMAGHELEVRADHPVTVLADRVELERLLLNLLYNARDALPGSGRITVTVRAEAYAARPTAVLEVVDDGVGMAPDVADQAFEPLFSTKGDGASTGLGLSTVRAIAERHGGTVALDSRAGLGTSVTVRLPLGRGEGATIDLADPAAVPATAPVRSPATAPATAPAGAGRTEVVLVVEDDAAHRRDVTVLLRRLGYATVGLSDGAAALDALRRRALPDAVLCSATLADAAGRPGGVRLAEQLADRYPHLPVVLMAGGPDSATTAATTVPGDDPPWPMLLRPLDQAELREVLAAALADEPALDAS